jgi:acyl phosphate:glycerol-3-phosphate acyltransferase
MSSAQTTLCLIIAAAYVLGSVPFGLLVGKAKGIDVRTAGSGNIGATNVGRLLGVKFFALVFLLDLLKGLLPMLAAGFVIGFAPGNAASTAGERALMYILWLGVGFASIFGHMFSVFLRFKGGKGVATSAGVVLGLFPYFTMPGVVALLIWGVVFARSKMVSLASIVAAIVFPIAYIAFALALRWDPFGEQLPLLCFAGLMGAMIVFRHRSNIARLRAGTESRFTSRSAKHAGNGRNGEQPPSTNGDEGKTARGG